MKDKNDNFSTLGMKINVDPEKNIINSNFIFGIINDLTLISNLLTEGDRFIAGYQLGRLQGDLVFLMEQLEVKEKKQEELKACSSWEDDYEDEDDEDDLNHELEDLKIELDKCKEEIKTYKNALMDGTDYIIDLIRKKTISPGYLPEAISILKKSGVPESDLKLMIDSCIH